jgi:hypothetical protein
MLPPVRWRTVPPDRQDLPARIHKETSSMRSKHHPLALLLALFATLALVLGACTDDGGEEETEAPSNTVEQEDADQSAEQLAELCTTGRDAIDIASGELDAALVTLGFAEPGQDQYEPDLEAADAAAQDLIDAMDAFVSDAQELDLPADQQSALDDYIASVEEQKANVETLKEGLSGDSPADVTDLSNQLAAVTDALDASGTEATEILQAQECGPDASGDDSGNSDDSVPDEG